MRKRFMIRLVLVALFSVAGTSLVADSTKYLIDHKGKSICVDDDSLDGHLGHGDGIIQVGCEL